MGITAYLVARELTANVGQPLLNLIFLLSIALAIFSMPPQLRTYASVAAVALALILGSGFLLADFLPPMIEVYVGLAAVALALVLTAGWLLLPQLLAYARLTVLALTLTLSAGWLLLVYFHYRIAADILLVDPAGGLPPGRFYIPVWVENEKFYFWTLILGLLTIAGRRRPAAFQSVLSATLAGFGILTYFTSNPFAQPLAEFHTGFSRYAAAMASGQNIMAQSQAYHALHGKLEGYYNSTYMWIHPPMLFIAYSTFVLAFIGCVFMLAKRYENYDKLAYAWAKPGFILLTVGLLIGYPWAVEAWKGEPWWYDPKINVTLMMWLLYSAYLHARLYIHRRGMWVATAILGYVAFLGVVVTYVTTYVIPGIHSVAG